jgi:predicted transglutaminase-like cysteine proteinase
MKQGIIITMFSLVSGAVLAYLLSYFLVYGPDKENLQNQVTTLESSVDDLEGTILERDDQISTLESESALYAQQVTDLELEVITLQTDLNAAVQQATDYQNELALLQLQSSDSQERLNRILGINVIQNYTWFYQYKSWNCDLPVLLATYVDYSERPRPTSISSYVDMAIDPDDDVFIDSVIQALDTVALQYHLNETQELNLVIALVQSMPYTEDSATTIADEYPRYPVETIFERGGDCEDTSILVAALLDAMGYDVALLHLVDTQHMAVGVAIPGASGQYYEYGGKQYFYLETTNEGWPIGQIPLELLSTYADVYPLRD